MRRMNYSDRSSSSKKKKRCSNTKVNTLESNKNKTNQKLMLNEMNLVMLTKSIHPPPLHPHHHHRQLLSKYSSRRSYTISVVDKISYHFNIIQSAKQSGI
tara:strand:- start:122 stop:421 length:300 start_codon:yes stop_codon:yes gene_type:complete